MCMGTACYVKGSRKVLMSRSWAYRPGTPRRTTVYPERHSAARRVRTGAR
ncbi:MAG: hypothetical protein ACLUI3_00795 [Christensenellales bacterium]